MHRLLIIQSKHADYNFGPVSNARELYEPVRICEQITGKKYQHVEYAEHGETPDVDHAVDCMILVDHELITHHVKCIPQDIGTLIVHAYFEAFSEPNFQVIKHELSHLSDIWYITNNLKIHQHKNIPDNTRVAAYDFFSGYTVCGMQEWQQPTDAQVTEQRDFLCLNNKPRVCRKHMVESLHRYGLGNMGYISYHTQLLEGTNPFDNLLDLGNADIVVPAFWDISPWTDKVYFEIVGEHVVRSNRFGDEDFIFITEKTYRSMLNGLPFLINGKPGTLEYLRHMGFRTYGELFDESYDQVTNWQARIQLIVAQAKKFSKLSTTQKQQWQQQAQPIVNHNREHLLNNYAKLYIDPIKGNPHES